MLHQIRTLIIALLALSLTASEIAMTLESTSAATLDWSPPAVVYIPETGHTLRGGFLETWRTTGQAASWGNPVTEEVTEKGITVQYFSFARFEYYPNEVAGKTIQFGAIGSELRRPAIHRTSTGSPDQMIQNQLTIAMAWYPVQNLAARPDSDTWRYVAATGHTVQFGFKQFWEKTGEATYLGNPQTEEFVCDGITYQIFERGELAWQNEKQVWMEPIGRTIAQNHGLDLAPVGQGDIPTYSTDLWVPPKPQPDPNAQKWIEVNLSWQYMIAWQGDVSVLESYVSTGRAGFETPTGTFSVLSKLESQDMEGVIGGEYYNVPDVPWVMYFTNYGHALHGTYWHNNFGTPMSHGCVNLPIDVAYWLYMWAPIGTPVVVHY